MVLEIRHRQETTRLAHCLVDGGTQLATVDGAGSLFRQDAKRIGEVCLNQPVTGLQRFAISTEDTFRIVTEFLKREVDETCDSFVDDMTVFGGAYGGL